jgi:hypothetical protein
MITTLSSLPAFLIDTIFNPDPTPHDLLILVSCIALFWWCIFQLLQFTLHPFALRQQWLRTAFAREYDRVGLSMCKALNVQWTKERYIQIFLNDWPKMQGIYLQHFIGGACCLPAVLHLCDEATASSLACLGVLSEMGWELSDMADIFITRTTWPDGKERMPNSMLVIFAIHHSMTLTLGLPMVLKYRQLRELHLLTFNLQWAAAIAIGVNEFTKCLDLQKRKQLWAFRIMNGMCFVIMAWMRGVQWVYLSWRMLNIWYADEEWACLCIGVVICLLISGFNFGLCIFPFYKKMIKFSVLKDKTLVKREQSGNSLMTEASLDEDDYESEEESEGSSLQQR